MTTKKIQERLREAGWVLAMALGLYSVVQLLADLRRDSPWPAVADAYQLTVWISLVMLYTCHGSTWAWVGASALVLRFWWEWRWGFACFPRRTRFGQWLDRRLAHLDHWAYNRWLK